MHTPRFHRLTPPGPPDEEPVNYFHSKARWVAAAGPPTPAAESGGLRDGTRRSRATTLRPWCHDGPAFPAASVPGVFAVRRPVCPCPGGRTPAGAHPPRDGGSR